MTTLRQLGEALGLDAAGMATLSDVALGESDPEMAGVSANDTDVPTGSVSFGFPMPPALDRRWRTDFIGRDRELRTLEKARDDRVRLVVIGGQAGIGKTRLVTRFASECASNGLPVLWGRCTEEGLGAYAPFIEITRQLVTMLDRPRLVRAVGQRGELLRILPELESHVGLLPSPTRAESGTEQRLLFESVSAMLGACAPMLIVIDDLHWADDATVSLLQYLACDSELVGTMIATTVRDSDVLPDLAGRLADLGRRVDTVRVHLEALEGDVLASLVTDLVGSPVAEEVVQSVADATGGNPFFAEEMTLHLIDAGLVVKGPVQAVLRGDARAVGVPDRVRETLMRRLLSLSSDALDLLTAGSIMGREFKLPLAGEVAGLEGDLLVDAAENGLLSGLVEETGLDSLAFSHALVQHAVGDRLSRARAAMVHRRVALVLEDLSTRVDPSEVPVADLARHWAAVAAFDSTAATVAAKWAVRAGDSALAAAAADDAIAHYEEASAFWAIASSGHADALVRLGTALQYRGRADEADTRFREALVLARSQGDAVLQARAAIGLGRRYPYWESDSDRIDALERALTELPEDEDLLRLSVMGLLVTQMINGFRMEEAQRRDELADHLAVVACEPTTDDETLAHLGHVRLYDCIEDPVRLTQVAARLVDVGATRNDLRVLSVARFSEALSALDQGSMDDLMASAEAYGDIADRLNDPRERSQAATLRSTIAFITGSYDHSEQLAKDALALGHESGDYNADLVFYAQGLLRAVDLGQAADVLPLLVAATDYQRIASFTAGTSLCAAIAGERELAFACLDRMVSTGLAGYPRGADRLAPTAFLAHSCALLGSAEHAETLYMALTSQPASAVRVGPLIGWWGPVDHHLGSLCRLLGRLEEAESHLRQALVIEERMGARPFSARTMGELARVLDETGNPEGEKLRSSAISEAKALGAAGITYEVSALA
jgi:tetratricopeptide (TPR) repeat protein